MNILSIQSHVAHGYVGNCAAVPALQLMGCNVWPIHTVEFSNHPGYGAYTGRVVDAAAIRDLVAGIEARGLLARCDGVVSGYLGTAANGEAVLDAVERVKRANPAAHYCCDPVIGDAERGVYVDTRIATFLRERGVGAADIATPNHFELDTLTGTKTPALSKLLRAIDTLHRMGPRTVLVTSVRTDDVPEDAIDLIVSDPGGRFRVRTPRLAIGVHGAGDMIAALFLAHILRGETPGRAAARAAASVFGVIRRTATAGARELLLVEAQCEIATPAARFTAQPL
ncbi:MAG: pyridoxal kinase PdxY [Proteobacteria bacterium]|nr:pyridoxal kinase PdxY [Pseudomonadota bacterium]